MTNTKNSFTQHMRTSAAGIFAPIRRLLRHERTVIGLFPVDQARYAAIRARFLGGQVVEIGEAFELKADDTQVSGSKAEFVLGLPADACITRTIRVPTSDPQQIARMLPHEILMYMPWPAEEGLFAYTRHDSDEEGYTLVTLFMARRETVEGHVATLRKCGIVPLRIEAASYSIARLLQTVRKDESPALLIADGDCLELVWLRKNGTVFSRETDGGESLDEMLQRSATLASRRVARTSSMCSSITLAGSTPPSCQVVKDALRSIHAFEDIEVFDSACLNGSPPSPITHPHALGAALEISDDQKTASLLPQREKRYWAWKSLLREAGWSAIQILLFVLIAIGIGYYLLATERARALHAEQELHALEEEAGDLREQHEALQLLIEERREVVEPLQVVLELYELTPASMAVNSFRYESKGQITIGGEAPSFQMVYAYLDELQSSQLLRDVRLVHSVLPRGATDGLVEFKLSAIVRNTEH